MNNFFHKSVVGLAILSTFAGNLLLVGSLANLEAIVPVAKKAKA